MKTFSMGLMALTLCAGMTACGGSKADSETKDSTNVENPTEATVKSGDFDVDKLPKNGDGYPIFISLTADDIILDETLQGKVEVLNTPDDEWHNFYKGCALMEYHTINFDISMKSIAPVDIDACMAEGQKLQFHAIPLDADGNVIEEQNDSDNTYWENSVGEEDLKKFLSGENTDVFNLTVCPETHIRYNTKEEDKPALWKQCYDELQKVKKVKISFFVTRK